MEEFNIHKWQAKHLRNKPLNENYITFDQFMNNLRNYSTDTDRDEMLTFLTKQIIQDYTTFDLRILMAIMAKEFQRDSEGNHIEDEMSEEL